MCSYYRQVDVQTVTCLNKFDILFILEKTIIIDRYGCVSVIRFSLFYFIHLFICIYLVIYFRVNMYVVNGSLPSARNIQAHAVEKTCSHSSAQDQVTRM